MSLNVYALGASRNIGYHAALRLLRTYPSTIIIADLYEPSLSVGKGGTVTFLLRSPSTFEGNETIQTFVRDGKAILVAGDALNKKDVAKGWETAQEASPAGKIDLVLFTVGP